MSRKNDNNLWDRLLACLLKIFYSLLYHQFAWTYDLVAWIVSGGNWLEWCRTIFSLINGKQVLELGHGPGHLQVELSQNGYHVFGLDRSPQMIKQAQKHLRSHQFHCRLVRADAEKLPFTNSSFDSVITTFPTEYIFEREAIQEIWRILKPQGKFIALVGVEIVPIGLYHRLLSVLYKSTGQDAPNDALMVQFLHRLNDIGFRSEVKWQFAAADKVLLVICTKGKSRELGATIQNNLL